ncbi:peptidase C14 [Syntrophotalea acetylenivorans]|uniref:Peptidase C14 n=1 Tax=Syntrophotalea acetylenivorans TaxID=1842532 RepID=A0A1L3GQV8_9BACT|nr:caspase family protein [Syntrophotalea acetylenivorans]APG28336.1 peptidase C14 [Syntrophotalea acetylenivorans]
MRKALVVGVDYYTNVSQLYGCVNDAYAVKAVLERNSDGTVNFGVNLVVGTSSSQMVTRRTLKDQLEMLFRDDSEIALFYFSGHGFIDSTGGYLVSSDTADGDDGLSMDDILLMANQSKARSKVVILDCCHSGIAGTPKHSGGQAMLSEGVTILTASSADQYAMEANGSGVFTSLLVDAMNGGAANLVGDVTPGSIYAHIDQSLGPCEQRPIFKTNVRSFVSLREVQAPIELEHLRRLVEFFPDPASQFQLDPTFEPEEDTAKDQNTERFAVLQKLNHVNLVTPVDEEHMYFAAINSKSCKLTVLGMHYWKLVKNERI